MSFNCLNQHYLPHFLSLQKILTDLKYSGQKQGNSMKHSKFKHKLVKNLTEIMQVFDFCGDGCSDGPETTWLENEGVFSKERL